MTHRGDTTRDPAVERVKRDFNRAAGAYDLRWAAYNLGSHMATIRHLIMNGNASVLDIGCGTGELERHIACKWPDVRVIAVDLCQRMIDSARAKFASTHPVRFMCGNAEHLPIRSSVFDLVVSCSAFHFIPDSRAAIREMIRVVRPGGQIVITDWCGDYLMCRLLDKWLMLTGRAAHAGSLPSRTCRSLAEEAGLSISLLETYRVDWIWGLMTLVASKPA